VSHDESRVVIPLRHIEPPARMWHVTLTLAGDPQDAIGVRAGLEQLATDHPFLLSGRYAADRAEVRYWDEALDVQDAATMALRMWGEYRESVGLPDWEVVGLEVIDQPTFHGRGQRGELTVRLATAGGVQPF